MQVLFVACGLLLGAAPVVRADDAKDPVEVDFAPLTGLMTGYALDFDFHTHGDVSFGGVSLIEKKSVTDIRDGFLKDLEERNWVVKAEGKTKLIIYGRKDDPIQKAEFKVDTFKVKPKGNVTPTVRRLKKA
jgi:hypothetical protein